MHWDSASDRNQGLFKILKNKSYKSIPTDIKIVLILLLRQTVHSKQLLWRQLHL